jgi:hypothetical protein
MKIVEWILILLSRMAFEERMDVIHGPEMHAFHGLAQVCGRPRCPIARSGRFLLSQATPFEFFSAAAWAGIVASDGRGFHG